MDRFRPQPWLWGAVGAAIAVPAIAFAVRRRRESRRGIPSGRLRAARPRIAERIRLRLRRRADASPMSTLRKPEPLVRRWVFNAPKERVFAYWTAFTDFPDFMDSVERVDETKPGCYRIRLRGPAGAVITWSLVLDRLVPGTAVEWTSHPDSEVQCAGTANFLPVEGGVTLVEVRMQYGAMSPWVAARMERFLQSDLPALIARDVLRMKELIETGSAGL